MKNCIFMVLTGNYDKLREPTYITPKWDYICLTNNPKLKSKIWEIIPIKDEGLPNYLLSRKTWMFKHNYLKSYDISVMIGGQSQPIGNLDKLLKEIKFCPDTEIALLKHPSRNCIYAEAKQCIRKKKDKPSSIIKQMNRYKKEGYPANNGLVATGIIVTQCGLKNIEKHYELWWKEVITGSIRDQLSFNYILWKHKLITPKLFNYGYIHKKLGYFKKYQHNEKTIVV